MVSGTPVQLGALTGGGWDGSQEPVGGTFVIGVNGDVLVGDGYTGNFLQITPAGADTTLAAGTGGSAAVLDSYGNLYFGGNYNANVYKVPYNTATGAYVGWSGSAPTTNCNGGNQDAAPCIFAPAVAAYMSGTLAGGGASGYAGMVFDGQGNFFFESNTLPATDANSIFECNLACLASTSATPKLIYQDANPIGALAIDPWGNLFFVDGNNSTGKVTNLNELPLSGGAYASSPTVLEAYTNKAGYGNGISGLAIGGNGTVYFNTNGDGVFAFPNTQSGGPKVSGIYMLATQGGKGLAIDSRGNLYNIPYNSGDVVSFVPVNNFSLGGTTIGGAATTATVNLFDSGAACSPTLNASVVEFGKTTTEFAIAPGATCGAALGTGNGTFSPAVSLTGAMISATITFNPISVGARNAALVISDSADSSTGVAALTGAGLGAMASLDPGAQPKGPFTGFTGPTSAVADPAGDVFVADSAAGKVYEIAAGSTTPAAIGSGFVNPSALTFDAKGNLYIADDGLPAVLEIANTGTTGAFAAGTQSTLIGSTAVFGGTALGSAMGIAIGPEGTLYVSDTANKRVVFLSTVTGQAGTTLAIAANGLSSPMGLAVDGSGDLFVADSAANKVFEFSSIGVVASITPPNVTQASGVAVDGSGSLFVSDAASGNVILIPNAGGSLSTSGAATVEKVGTQASSLWMDASGNLFSASTSGKSAYAIMRNSASVNLGTVSDGVTQSANVFLENSGNAAATLATPVVTEPANTMFTLNPATSNACTAGGSGPAGAFCELVASFTPPPGTANGAQTGTGSINVATPAVTLTVSMSGTATQSSILPQTITGFTPPATLQVGQQITLSATGGASGNPVTFSIDAGSACPTCATIGGKVLTAAAVGAIKVDANQAAGSANGNQYAAATQVQAAITVSNTIVPPGVPALLMYQQDWLLALPGGGVFAQDSQAGTSFGVNQQGNVIMGTSYGDSVALYNAATNAWTKLGSYGKYNNTGGVAVDSAGNLYLGALYSGIIAKVPYHGGAYSAVTDATSGTPPANCTGTDTAECVVAGASNTAGIGGVSAMTFDSAGDLFIGTDDQGNNPWSIWECTAACMASTTGTPAPVMLYQEPAGNNSSTTVGQYYTGGLGVDPWGNLFFTDSLLLNQANNASDSVSSDLYYLPKSTGAGFGGATTGYAAAPTLLQTFTDKTPGGYDDELDAVAVGSDGTVYYSLQYDGMFAIPNTQSGGPAIASQYVVSGQGAKDMEVDSHGNIFYAAYYNGTGGDTLGEIVNASDLVTPNAQYLGAPVTASATVVDNAFGCGTAATLAIASSNAEFAATAGTTCSSIAVGSGNGTVSKAVPPTSSYGATITFAATKPASQSATLSLSDTTNGGQGTATVTGYALTTPQTIAFTAPVVTTYTYAPALTVNVSVSNGASNNPVAFTVDPTSTGAGTFSATTVTGKTSSATLTVTQAGSIVIDANEPGGLVSGTYYNNATLQLTITINQATQTIVFPAIAPATYSPTLTVTLSATGGASTNPVVFTIDASSTGQGSIAGNVLTVTQAGTFVIDANQAADTNDSKAAQVQQILVVNQAGQTIAFTPITTPLHYIASCPTLAQCAMVSIQATGGATSNPIAISPDPTNTVGFTTASSTTSKAGVTTAVLVLLPSQSFTFPTKLIIDGNQQGNANYSAAPQQQLIISVMGPLPLQTITWANPGTQIVGGSLTLSATSSAGASYPIAFASNTPSVCTVTGTTPKFVSSGACTITASQPGDNTNFAAAIPLTQTFAVNALGQAPSMNMSLSLPSLTIQPGTTGLTQITITSVNNFASAAVNFACSGLPTGYTCSFNPSSTVAFTPTGSTGLPGASSASTTLSITTPSTAALERHSPMPFVPATLAVALCFIGFRKRSRLRLLLLLVAFLAGLGAFSACGGSSATSTTKSTSSTVTITATPASGMSGASASVTSTATLTVVAE